MTFPVPRPVGPILLVLLSVLVGNLASGFAFAEAQDPSSRELAPYHGNWNRIPDQDAEAARLSSIDSAIEDLSWIVRRMAVGVLRKTTAPPGEMNFAWDGEKLLQVLDGPNGVFERPVLLGGAPQTLTDPRGEDFTSEWAWTSDGLEVRWKQDQAFGSNVYRVDETGRTLRVQHQIQVTALEGVERIEFESRFQRQALPAVSSRAMQEPTDDSRVISVP